MRIYNLLKLVSMSVYSKKLVSFLLLIMSGVSIYMVDSVMTEYFAKSYKSDYMESMFGEDAYKVNYIESMSKIESDNAQNDTNELMEYVRNQDNVTGCGRFCNSVGIVNDKYFEAIIIEEDIVDIGNLQLSEKDKEKIKTENYSCVFVGYDYKKEFNIGDTFSLYNDSDDNCIVAGYLKKDSSWPKSGRLFGAASNLDSFTLNKKIVVVTDKYNELGSSPNMPDIIYYVVNDVNKTLQIKSNILKKAAEMSLGVKIVNEGEVIEQEKKDNNITDDKTFLAAVLLSMLAIIAISAASIIFCLLRKYQYGVMMTCGVSQGEIMSMIFIENAVIIIVAAIVAWIVRQRELFGGFILTLPAERAELIIYPYYYAHCIEFPILLASMVLIMTFVSGAIPAYIVRNMNVSDIISANE